jgi:hypothetical protein
MAFNGTLRRNQQRMTGCQWAGWNLEGPQGEPQIRSDQQATAEDHHGFTLVACPSPRGLMLPERSLH